MEEATDQFEISFEPPIEPAGRTYRSIDLEDADFRAVAQNLRINWEAVYTAGGYSFSYGRGQMIHVLVDLVQGYRAARNRTAVDIAPLGFEMGRIDFLDEMALVYDLDAPGPDEPVARCSAADVERAYQSAASALFHRMLEYIAG